MVNRDYQKFINLKFNNDTKAYQQYEFNLKGAEIVDGIMNKNYLVLKIAEKNLLNIVVLINDNSLSSKFIAGINSNVTSFDAFEDDNLLSIYAV